MTSSSPSSAPGAARERRRSRGSQAIGDAAGNHGPGTADREIARGRSSDGGGEKGQASAWRASGSVRRRAAAAVAVAARAAAATATSAGVPCGSRVVPASVRDARVAGVDGVDAAQSRLLAAGERQSTVRAARSRRARATLGRDPRACAPGARRQGPRGRRESTGLLTDPPIRCIIAPLCRCFSGAAPELACSLKSQQPIGVGAGVLGALVGGWLCGLLLAGGFKKLWCSHDAKACLPARGGARVLSWSWRRELWGLGWGQRRLSDL